MGPGTQHSTRSPIQKRPLFLPLPQILVGTPGSAGPGCPRASQMSSQLPEDPNGQAAVQVAVGH